MKCFIGIGQMCPNIWIVTMGAARIFRRRNSDNLFINFHLRLYLLVTLEQFSNFVRPRPDNFFFYKTRAQYQAMAWQLKNTVLEYFG
jgi:hypothetical protein